MINEIRILSIDSSLANTGVAFCTYNGVDLKVSSIRLFTTSKSKVKTIRASSDTIARCRGTFRFLMECIEEFDPGVIIAETPSGSQSAASMRSYGATCQLLASLPIPPIEVTPIEVKTMSVGKKNASKKEMIDWAYNLYPDLDWFWHGGKLQNKNEHMADAIAIAYSGVGLPEFEKIESILKI